MYVGSGDAGSGEQRDSRRLNPQRLDTLVGKILRIVPDLREHVATSTVSENGRYRVPTDNPFSALEDARKEIWVYGLRNPHRMIWDVDPARPRTPVLFAFNIGLAAWETVVIVRKGANYGYSLREGTQTMSADGMGAVPEDDTIPIRISDTVVRGHGQAHVPGHSVPRRTTAVMPSPAVSSTAAARSLRSEASWCSATSRQAGFGTPSLPTCSRPTMARRRPSRRRTRWTPVSAGSWKKPTAPAAAGVRDCPALPPSPVVDAWTSGSRSTTTARSTLLTKSDGMIRKVVDAGPRPLSRHHSSRPSLRPSPDARNQAGTPVTNPVAATPASIAAGKKAYDANCAACHGNMAQGAVKAGVVISIIEEQGGKQAPDLTDDRWDHGSTDGEIYTVIKRGIPPTMMAGWDGRIPDNDIWSIVNYLRTLAPKK